jgi:hypothetical protein
MNKCRAKYGFVKGESYLTSEVVGVCDERIREGYIKREKTKTVVVRAMEKYAPPKMLWQPLSESGFGASPFNPNCWCDTDGRPITSISPDDWRRVSEELKVIRAENYK